MRKLVVDVRPGAYAVFRLPAGQELAPELLKHGGFVSVTSTDTEISVISAAELAPADAPQETGWRLLTVRGPLEFTLTGIMASLASALAAAGVPMFALSTFDTDHVLVKDADLTRAVAALNEAGHEVNT